MLTQCMSSCNVCHLDTNAKRCVELDDHPPALQPGDIDRMFTRLTTQLDGVNTSILSRDPWVVLVRDAVHPDEVEHLLKPRKWIVASDTGTLPISAPCMFATLLTIVQSYYCHAVHLFKCLYFFCCYAVLSFACPTALVLCLKLHSYTSCQVPQEQMVEAQCALLAIGKRMFIGAKIIV